MASAAALESCMNVSLRLPTDTSRSNSSSSRARFPRVFLQRVQHVNHFARAFQVHVSLSGARIGKCTEHQFGIAGENFDNHLKAARGGNCVSFGDRCGARKRRAAPVAGVPAGLAGAPAAAWALAASCARARSCSRSCSAATSSRRMPSEVKRRLSTTRNVSSCRSCLSPLPVLSDVTKDFPSQKGGSPRAMPRLTNLTSPRRRPPNRRCARTQDGRMPPGCAWK